MRLRGLVRSAGRESRPGGAGRRRLDPRPPRARRCSVSRRARPGIRVPPPVDRGRGRRRAAAQQRGRDDLDRLQRRDLQPRIAARPARGEGPPLPDPQRHREHRARVRGVGRRVRRAAARDVRLRALGPPPAPAAPRPRPRRDQAPLPDARGRSPRVRIGDQGAVRLPRRCALGADGGPGRAPHAALCRISRHAVRGHREARGRSRPRS